jgi:hypothetical protein
MLDADRDNDDDSERTEDLAPNGDKNKTNRDNDNTQQPSQVVTVNSVCV